jgi:hypothetical protein
VTASAQTVVTVSLKDILQMGTKGRIILDRRHGERHRCPSCDADVMHEAIVRLVYTFATCTCRNDGITYDHLVEQAWHAKCFVVDAAARGATGVAS